MWWRRFSESGSSWIVRHCHHFLAFGLEKVRCLTFYDYVISLIINSRIVELGTSSVRSFANSILSELDPTLLSLDLFVC